MRCGVMWICAPCSPHERPSWTRRRPGGLRVGAHRPGACPPRTSAGSRPASVEAGEWELRLPSFLRLLPHLPRTKWFRVSTLEPSPNWRGRERPLETATYCQPFRPRAQSKMEQAGKTSRDCHLLSSFECHLPSASDHVDSC